MTLEPVVKVRGLRFAYDDGTLALDGVDFELFQGETVALFGPNGSGKTTFVHHLNGLLLGQGSVTVCGVSVEKKNLAAVRRRIGMVFQDAEEQLFMPSVLDDVAFGPLNLGLTPEEARERALDSLARAGAGHVAAKAPYHLSAGEKRRVALAGVLAMEPDILVLDEPTTFLDPPGQRELLALLRKLPQAKILVTHDVAFAAMLATRAVFFAKGRIAGEGRVADIVNQFGWAPGL